MKDFLKFTLASVVGIVLAGIVFTILGISSIISLVAASDTETVIKDPSVLVLDFNGTLYERVIEDPFQQLLGEEFISYGLNDVLASIKKAKEHENIKGICLNPINLTASYASLEEIRDALADFKESGKFIIAHADQYTQSMYYLCSVADKVIVNPQGSIGWHGLATQSVFFKDMLEKIGVDVQVFKVGTYKSAVEPFTATEMSPANREQINAFLSSIWNNILDDVSVSRNLSKKQLNALADKYMDLSRGEEYVQSGLADTLMYKDEVIAYLKQLTGKAEYETLETLYMEDMIHVRRNVLEYNAGNVIAVYYASGEIVDQNVASSLGTELIVGEDMARDLRCLRDDDHVKAVVLRVNSPGGSAYASELIWREVVRLKEKKPVVVSMGDYAASGGYYISCAATTIFADPTTLTGSIGIFGMFPSGEKLLQDKLGLDFDVVKTNKLSDMGTAFGGAILTRPFNAGEKEIFQQYINQGYELFVSRCAEGRKMSIDDIKKIAEGRVWTGETAKELGLVDELGGIDQALAHAAQLAGIENYSVLSQPVQEDFLMILMNSGQKHYISTRLQETLGGFYGSYRTLEHLKNAHPIQARMPFDLNIH